jgi:hypothetical protein
VNYHDHDSISKSGLDKVARSIDHYMAYRSEGKDTHALRLGRLVHTVVLEIEQLEDEYAIAPEFRTKDGKPSSGFRTAEAKQWLAEVEADGRTPITADQLAEALRIRESVHAHPSAHILLDNVIEVETPRFWHWEDYGVDCRCKPDALVDVEGDIFLLDLKTTRDASADAFARSCAKYRYDVQWAFYGEGLYQASGIELAGMVIVAVESESPHTVACYELDDAWLERGQLLMWQDMQRYADWMHGRVTHTGYSPEVRVLQMPRWA